MTTGPESLLRKEERTATGCSITYSNLFNIIDIIRTRDSAIQSNAITSNMTREYNTLTNTTSYIGQTGLWLGNELSNLVQVNNNLNVNATIYPNSTGIVQINERGIRYPSNITNTITPFAATVAENNFKTYENSTFGIKIQYPSNWMIKYPTNQSHPAVQFDSPTYAGVLISYTPTNISFSQGITNLINGFRSASDRNITESTPTTLAGNPAHKFVYTEADSHYGILKHMNIISRIDSRFYIFLYSETLSDYPVHLLEAQRTLDSFQVMTPLSSLTPHHN